MATLSGRPNPGDWVAVLLQAGTLAWKRRKWMPRREVFCGSVEGRADPDVIPNLI